MHPLISADQIRERVMKQKTLIKKSIEQFYNNASEETRLEKGMGIFEFDRIKTLISKHIYKDRSTIIDVGGGTGKYTAWLASLGHQAHLVEPVSKHIILAKKRASRSKKTFSIHHGEAQNLPFKNNTADLVILHGPLYHLQEEKERQRAIQEAQRICKSGGIILGVAINYTASTFVGLLNGLIHKPAFFSMCEQELTSGLHNPPDEFPWLLAEAFYHTPALLKQEFASRKLKYLNTYAVEGIVWLDSNYFTNMTHDTKQQVLKALVQLTETDPHLLSVSPHMIIAVKVT